MESQPALTQEPTLSSWGRRAITLSLYPALFVTVLALLPLLAPLALAVDLVRRKRFATLRCLVFFLVYLACELAGIVAAGALWLAAPLHGGLGSERSRVLHYRLQGWWANALYRGTELIYGLSRELDEGDADPGRGPVIVFARHASVGDTVIPAVYLTRRHGLRLRYVLKRELLWDPCLDLVGNRLPNYFVQRGSSDTGGESERVARLLESLGPRDGVLIYPEGTRFTPSKRERVLARMEKSADARLVARARGFERVLPPRLGGSLALLDRNPGADVLFCAHVGFDAAATFWHFWNGTLVGETIRVRFWRVPAAEIPKERDARIDWLFGQWERMDAYVREKYPAT
jgi:1-acyl-sn-glycerol-3-phosphate acyltransferase